MRPGIILAAAGLLACSSPLAAHAEGSIEEGREIAAKHCTRCHVVGDINPTGGISSTPSFQLLVKRRPDYKDRFQTFFVRRPHPAFLWLESLGRIRPDLPPNAEPVELTEDDVRDILAFIETLKPESEEAKEKAKKPLVLSPRPKPRTQ